MANSRRPPGARDDDIDNIRRRDNLDGNREEKNLHQRNEDVEYDRRDNGGPPSRNAGLGWLWPILLLFLILLLLWWLFVGGKVGNTYNINQNQQSQQESEDEFLSANSTSNYQRSIPSHADTIPAPPSSILIQTTSPVTRNSDIRVNFNNQDYGRGETVISSNGQSFQRTVDQNAPDGLYTVNYKTCGSDGECQDGDFQFRINRGDIQGYDDQRNKSGVTISYENGKFYPENVLISKGTKVTWVNNNSQSFTIQSGLVGTTNYFVSLKSNSVNPQANFSYTFGQEGYYPYFGTVDGKAVTGKVIVQ